MSHFTNHNGVFLVVILMLAGCSSSRQRKEGIQELEKLQADVHGLHILVSAGVTKQEYSQRFEDVLLKLGDLNQNATETVPKFPQGEQETAKTVYAHLSQSINAYKKARVYFGDSFEGYSCEGGCSFFPQSEYDAVKREFPTLAELNLSPVAHEYHRSSMLQALWAVAGEEDDQAKRLVDEFNQK